MVKKNETNLVLTNVVALLVAAAGVVWTWFAYTKFGTPFPLSLGGLVVSAGALLYAISRNRR